MKVGFTGTRNTPTSQQWTSLYHLLSGLNPSEGHHGDCVGADVYFHKAAEYQNIAITIHPPTDNSFRAFCTSSSVRAPKPYLERNRNIVDETPVLIAVPKDFVEELRSGTWSTIRYARIKRRRIYIIFPDGGVRQEGLT